MWRGAALLSAASGDELPLTLCERRLSPEAAKEFLLASGVNLNHYRAPSADADWSDTRVLASVLQPFKSREGT